MKYLTPEMKILNIREDILTLSDAGINGDKDWGNLNFGGAKNLPLADLANELADKF